MVRVVLIWLMCLVYSLGMSQATDSTFSVCKNNSDYKLIYVAGGVFFFPLSDAENLPDSIINYCSGKRMTYFVNNMELTENLFISLNLKPKYIDSGQGVYKFNYTQDKCVQTILMSVNINLPFILNGEKLNADNQKEILSKISSENIQVIKRKGSFLGGGGIYIETKSRH